jgi:predicted enzyme related to lactoylglutathione lyase
MSRASAFYKQLFGWDVGAPANMGLPADGSYLIFSKKGTAAHGGFQLVKPEALVAPKEANQWAVRITFTVESVDAALAEAEKAGGEILE